MDGGFLAEDAGGKPSAAIYVHDPSKPAGERAMQSETPSEAGKGKGKGKGKGTGARGRIEGKPPPAGAKSWQGQQAQKGYVPAEMFTRRGVQSSRRDDPHNKRKKQQQSGTKATAKRARKDNDKKKLPGRD